MYFGTIGHNTVPKQNVFKANMQKYRIKFESGCLYDDHCNKNGIDDEDSDIGATCSLGGNATVLCQRKMFNIMDLHVLEAAKGGHNRKAVSLTWLRQHDSKRRFELTPFTLSTQPRPGIATTTFPINVQMAEI